MSHSATGYVLIQYDYASICMKIHGRGTTGPEAKDQTQQPAEAVFSVLKEFEIKDTEYRSTFDLKENTRYSHESKEHEFAGYKATRYITVFVRKLEHLSELHDRLTSVNGVEVGQPKLKLLPETRMRAQEEALEQAFKKAKRRWENECRILGLDSSHYYQSTPSVDYDGRYDTDVGGEVTQDGDTLHFHAGAALVKVKLSLNYYKKEEFKER